MEVEARLAPDLVVLDIRMPGGDGGAGLRAVKIRSPGTTVLMLTNYATPVHRERCVAAGADGFLDKSAELDRLVELVARRVHQHSIDSAGRPTATAPPAASTSRSR